MQKKKVYLSKDEKKMLGRKRGDRVKDLLKESGMKQSQLAERLGMQEANLNAKLNGQRTLTEDDAKEIADIFSNSSRTIRYQWILDPDVKYATVGEEFTGVMNNVREEAELLDTGFKAFAMVNGYNISLRSRETEELEEIIDIIKQGVVIEKDDKRITLGLAELNRLQNKIADMFDLELRYLFKERG